MSVYQLDDRQPTIDATAWVAPSAIVIGNVRLEAGASIWWHTVVRGDSDAIIIGAGSNVQDNSVLHTDPGIVLELGPNVTIGHRVILHGCSIGANSLVGMGSVIMNRARIGRNSLVGANTLIAEGKSFPDGVLIMGSPGKVIRELSEVEIAGLARSAAHYVENAKRFSTGLAKLA